MWSSPLFWIVVAIVLFWALGAYNRLMRLRSAVIQAFGGVDVHLLRLVTLLGDIQGVSGGGSARQALQAAAPQLGASLALARARPLDVEALAALAVAKAAADAAWAACTQSQEPGQNEALAPFRGRWEELSVALQQAVAVLNASVALHNSAVRQFPAVVLARTFGFRPAQGL